MLRDPEAEAGMGMTMMEMIIRHPLYFSLFFFLSSFSSLLFFDLFFYSSLLILPQFTLAPLLGYQIRSLLLEPVEQRCQAAKKGGVMA